jgi:acetyl esterase
MNFQRGRRTLNALVLLASAVAPPSAPAAFAQAGKAQDAAQVRAIRDSYRAMIPSAGSPDDVASVQAITIPAADGAPLRARVYVPKGVPSGALPILLYLHGGGWASGDLDTHDVMVRSLANASGAVTVALEYRLAPESPFPTGLEDCYAALTWIAKNGASIGGDPDRIAVSGDSAGGNLAAAVALLARKRSGPRLSALLLLYPNVGNSTETGSWKALGTGGFPTIVGMHEALDRYLPANGPTPLDPLVSPLQADLHGLPPALVIVGGRDPLKDEGHAFAEKLRAAGVTSGYIEYPGAIHGFVQFYKDRTHNPLGEEALKTGAGFLQSRLARGQ